MRRLPLWLLATIPGVLAILGGAAFSGEGKDTVQVPNGLAFAEFKGYERWEIIGLSHGGERLAVIVGNPAMIDAYKAGIPDNGKPFPDGAKMAKIHWNAKTNEEAPGQPQVSGELHDVDVMAKDSQRFADSGGWGYGAFMYEKASDDWRPFTTADSPPQEHDAKCGFACHTVVQNRDYVFTTYARR
jgi:hypothetical protein